MALATAMNALWPLITGRDHAQKPGNVTESKTLEPELSERLAYNDRVVALRPTEYPQLKDTIYLDHAGTTLPSKSLVDDFSHAMLSNLVANPHSAPASSSQFSSRMVDDVRLRVLRFFNADPDDFDVIFIANATAGIKLVGECLRCLTREDTQKLWYGYHKDAHTSLVGLREDLSQSLESTCFASDQEVESFLEQGADPESHGEKTVKLLGYPAQSNMNGRKLPLSWLGRAREAGVYTLLDAAALVSTSSLDLSDRVDVPDFTVLSFYKIFGFPDLGALIVRKDAGHLLARRRYFGGGTVEMVTCLQEQWHIRKQGSLHTQLEDGTLPVHSILALNSAMVTHGRLFGPMHDIAAHTSFLADRLDEGLRSLRHGNNQPVCEIYGRRSDAAYGPTVAFNILNPSGGFESNFEIEKLAAIRNIQLRTGGVCNPGGIASSLNLSPWEMQSNFSAGQRCGGERDLQGGKPTGIIRVSIGAMSTLDDVNAFWAFVREFFVHETTESESTIEGSAPTCTGFRIESLTVYPIKSCAGWIIPQETPWNVRPEGLAWDREWCLIHAGTRAALSQKQFPRMALLRPKIDLAAGLLRVTYHGTLPPNAPTEVLVPLSANPAPFSKEHSICASSVCGDDVRMRTYASDEVNRFFSLILDTPCLLARFTSSNSGKEARHAKEHLSRRNTGPRPLLLSNESPILVVSRSSLNRLNETIKSRNPPGSAAPASVFRANIVLAEDSAGFEQPYAEEFWTSMRIRKANSVRETTRLDILGPCRRCQMVCIDQTTGQKSINGEPFVSLSKTRRRNGRVWFGMHSALVGNESLIQAGDVVDASCT